MVRLASKKSAYLSIERKRLGIKVTKGRRAKVLTPTEPNYTNKKQRQTYDHGRRLLASRHASISRLGQYFRGMLPHHKALQSSTPFTSQSNHLSELKDTLTRASLHIGSKSPVSLASTSEQSPYTALESHGEPSKLAREESLRSTSRPELVKKGRARDSNGKFKKASSKKLLSKV
jgi:hypothetical protein